MSRSLSLCVLFIFYSLPLIHDTAGASDVAASATRLYADDFESTPAGRFPRQFVPRGPHRPGPEIFSVEKLDDGNQVLSMRGKYYHHLQLPLASRLDHGVLHLAFDLQVPEDHEQLRTVISVDSLATPIDVGWRPGEEYGAYLSIKRKDGKQPVLNRVAFDRKETELKALETGRWYRVALALDLVKRVYDINIDGQSVGTAVPFRDQRWFLGAERLTLWGGHLLVDNLSLSHVPGDPADTSVPRTLPIQARHVPAHRLQDAPVIDGDLGDAAWESAWSTDLWYTATGHAAEANADLRVGYHRDGLYIGVRARESKGDAAPSELNIALDLTGTRYNRHLWFKVAEDGTISHRTSDGRSATVNWRARTTRADGAWTVECMIPLSDCARVYYAAPSWALQVLLNGRAAGPAGSIMLCPHDGQVENSIRFANFSGLGMLNAGPLRCRILPPTPPHTGPCRVEAEVWSEGFETDEPVIAQLTLQRPDGKSPTFDSPPLLVEPRTPIPLTFDVDLDRPGGYAFNLTIWPAKVAREHRHREQQLGVSRLRVVEVQAPGSFHLLTDRNYYMTERVARVRCTYVGRPFPAGATAFINTKGENDTLYHSLQSLHQSPAVIDVDLEALPLGHHELSVSLRDATETEIASAVTPLVRLAPKREAVQIRWDGVTLIGGRPFFPVYLWSSHSVKSYTLGCNAMLIGSFQLPLSRYDQEREVSRNLGMKWIYWPANPFVNPEEAPAKLADAENDPLFMSWLVEDEPNPLPKAEPVAVLRDTIKALDPYRPTHLTYVGSWGRFYRDGLVTADVVGTNAYASYWYYEPLSVMKTVRSLAANVDDGHGMWTTLQAWHSQANRTHPTPLEFEHTVWSAIAAGSTGIGLWGCDFRNGFGGEDIRGMMSDPKLWHAAARVLRSVRRLEPVLTSDGMQRPEASVENDWVQMRTWRHEGDTYVLLVNMRGGPETTNLHIPGTSGPLSNLLKDEILAQGESGIRRIVLGPFEAKFLRVEGGTSR